MPKFVIERQYLLPIYQRLIIDAPDIETACQEAVEHDEWESAEEDVNQQRSGTPLGSETSSDSSELFAWRVGSQWAPIGTPTRGKFPEALQYLAAVYWWGPASMLKHTETHNPT